jgi:hypothetical protein
VTAKIVAMNNRGPSVCDDDGCLRSDITDIANIIGNLDEANGRNDALRCYILALRDLQRAHDRHAALGDDAEIDAAQAAVAAAFRRLIVAEFSLWGLDTGEP